MGRYPRHPDHLFNLRDRRWNPRTFCRAYYASKASYFPSRHADVWWKELLA